MQAPTQQSRCSEQISQPPSAKASSSLPNAALPTQAALLPLHPRRKLSRPASCEICFSLREKPLERSLLRGSFSCAWGRGKGTTGPRKGQTHSTRLCSSGGRHGASNWEVASQLRRRGILAVSRSPCLEAHGACFSLGVASTVRPSNIFTMGTTALPFHLTDFSVLSSRPLKWGDNRAQPPFQGVLRLRLH